MHQWSKRFFVFGIFATLLILAAQPSGAQSNPSAESCAGLGMIDVQCYNCNTGEYLGMINVQAEYDDYNKDCLRSKNEARGRCAGAYGVPEDTIGMKWKYTIGMTNWKNYYPRNNCPSAQW